MTSTISILKNGAAELRGLRRENEILRAKVEVIDVFAAALFSQRPSFVRGEAVDVAWQMDRAADEMLATEQQAAAAPAGDRPETQEA